MPTRAIAEAIGAQLDCRSRRSRRGAPSTSAGSAGSSAIDVPASSARTRELLGWEPTQPGLLEDLEQGHYTHEPVA